MMEGKGGGEGKEIVGVRRVERRSRKRRGDDEEGDKKKWVKREFGEERGAAR